VVGAEGREARPAGEGEGGGGGVRQRGGNGGRGRAEILRLSLISHANRSQTKSRPILVNAPPRR
jgi:hypothetical protein